MEVSDNLGVRRINLVYVMVLFLTHFALIPPLEGKLLGDHVCETKITVPQEVLQWELKNRTTRTYKWCMNVPPRCSVYSNRLVNETRISIINVTKSIETCCEGFKEQNNFCVSQCQDCQNGLCISGFCVCHPGWNGLQCESRIPTTTPTSVPQKNNTETTLYLKTTSPEKYETYTSSLATALSKEGTSVSPTYPLPATSDTDNFITLTKKPFNEEITVSSIFSKDYNISTSPLTPTTTTKNPILEQMLTIYKQYFSKSSEMSNEEIEGSGSTYRPRIEEASETSYYDTTVTQPTYVSSTAFIEDKAVFDSKENSENAKSFENILSNVDIFDEGYFTNNTLKENDIGNYRLSTTSKSNAEITKLSIPKSHDVENAVLKENLLKNKNDFIGERFEKRSSVESFGQNNQLTVTESASKNLIYSICAASLTTFLILVVVVTLYAVKNSRKKVEKNKARQNMESVAVYTTSIFHSPLPDPPTFENPTYLTSGSIERNGLHRGRREVTEIPEFQVVFQKPKPIDCKQCKPYLYDHPPSTGSYRASSEVDTLSQYNFSQRSLPAILEPLYDEIPSKDNHTEEGGNLTNVDRRSNRIEPNCLYINTCGRTKF